MAPAPPPASVRPTPIVRDSATNTAGLRKIYELMFAAGDTRAAVESAQGVAATVLVTAAQDSANKLLWPPTEDLTPGDTLVRWSFADHRYSFHQTPQGEHAIEAVAPPHYAPIAAASEAFIGVPLGVGGDPVPPGFNGLMTKRDTLQLIRHFARDSVLTLVYVRDTLRLVVARRGFCGEVEFC